jgi:hypothetical protein
MAFLAAVSSKRGLFGGIHSNVVGFALMPCGQIASAMAGMHLGGGFQAYDQKGGDSLDGSPHSTLS